MSKRKKNLSRKRDYSKGDGKWIEVKKDLVHEPSEKLNSKHYLAKEYKVSLHAVERFIERVYGLEPKDATQLQKELVAKHIDEMIPERSRILGIRHSVLIEDGCFYACVEANGIVTTIKEA